MKKFGMVVAIQRELKSALDKLGVVAKKIEDTGYTTLVYEYPNYTLYVVNSGAGEISASSATQYLITKHNVDIIVNFGVVGGLCESMQSSDLCVVDSVVHYDYDISATDNVETGRYLEYPSTLIPLNHKLIDTALNISPTLNRVICASGDKFIADADKKLELHTRYNAKICDMESAGIVITCDRNKVPCIMIKAVADSLFGGAEEFDTALQVVADKCIDITTKIIKNI